MMMGTMLNAIAFRVTHLCVMVGSIAKRMFLVSAVVTMIAAVGSVFVKYPRMRTMEEDIPRRSILLRVMLKQDAMNSELPRSPSRKERVV